MKHFKLKTLAAIISSVSLCAQAEPFAIEEIVVTAQKRAQSVSEIGVAVSAFAGDEMRDLGVDNPEDLAAYTPGLSANSSSSGGTTNFTIRGIGLDDVNANNTGGVAVYFDEVLAAYPVFLNGNLFDTERVEVLKGPQGTLYGRNTTGGAVNFVSAKPTEDFQAYITAGVARYNTYETEAAVSGQLTEGINSRLALASSTGDGWQKDKTTGKDDFGAADTLAVRSLTSFEINDEADLLLNLHYSRNRTVPSVAQTTGTDAYIGTPLGTNGTPKPKDVTVVRSDVDTSRDESGYGGSAILTMDFDAFTLTSISAYDQYQRDVKGNLDGSALQGGDYTYDDEFDVYSQEFRLTSNQGEGFFWVTGFTYAYDEVAATPSVNSSSLAGRTRRVDADYTQKSTSIGAYIHTETDLSEAWRLTVGARYSYDKRDFDYTSTDRDASYAQSLGVKGAQLIRVDETKSENNLSGKIGLDYSPNDDWLFYGSVTTSYKSGVFYGSAAATAGAVGYIKPEEVVSYELGFKGSMLDDTLQLTGAAYIYDYEDRQSLAVPTSPVDGNIYVTLANIEKAQTTGAELELRWLPFDGLDLRVGASYISSAVKTGTTKVRGNSLLGPIKKGADLPQAPNWSYSAVARYQWAVFEGYSAIAQATYTWTDEQILYLGDPNANYGEIDEAGIRLILAPDSEDWQVSAWVSNLENHNASVGSFSGGLPNEVSFFRQSPKNYGVEFTYNF